jgi:hypothetical protein
MKKFFFAESKLVFERLEKQDNDVDAASEGLRKQNYQNIQEAQRVMQEQSTLRERLDLSDVLTDKDKAKWKNKLDRAKADAISENDMKKLSQEFEQQQTEIKSMVDTYTQKVMTKKIEAFTPETADEYVEWFEKQTYEKKADAFKKIDDDIKERLALRKKLLTRFKKEDVYKMERTEMRDKVKILETIEKNIKTYKDFIGKDKKLFHDPDQYIREFEDQTVEEQARWLRLYEKEVKAPRKAIVDIYERLPKKYQNDSKFFTVGLKEKQQHLEKLDMKIEQDYIKKVNETDNDVMSQNSKRFAIVDFLRLQDISQKALWLEQLPKSIKAEKKLTKEYKDALSKFKDPNSGKKLEFDQYSQREWEKLTFEEKEKLLKNMNAEAKLLETFGKILKQGLKDYAICEKTYERYMNLYTGNNINGRIQLTRNVLPAMKIRRDLVEDFTKLDKETQNKYKDFYNHGYKKRIQIFKEAQLFESKQKAKEDADLKEKEKEEKEDTKVKEKADIPKSLEQKDVQDIVNEMHKEADSFEATEQYERAMDKHDSVLMLHSDNKYSLKKKKEIQDAIDTMDSLLDDDIEEAVNREAMNSSVKEELDQIKLAQMILEDREEVVRKNQGNENLGKQKTHLSQDSFVRNVHEDIYKKSGGKQILGKDGKIKNVEQVNLGSIGSTHKSDVKKYKDKFNALKERENLEGIELINTQGKTVNIKEGTQQLENRRKAVAKKMSKRVKSSAKEKDVQNAAEELIEEQLTA